MQDSDKRDIGNKKPWQLSFYMVMMGIGLGILILAFLLLLVGGGLSAEYGIFMVCSNLLFLLVSGATLFLLEKRKKAGWYLAVVMLVGGILIKLVGMLFNIDLVEMAQLLMKFFYLYCMLCQPVRAYFNSSAQAINLEIDENWAARATEKETGSEEQIKE